MADLSQAVHDMRIALKLGKVPRGSPTGSKDLHTAWHQANEAGIDAFWCGE